MPQDVAIVVGAGPGLGAALARRFAEAGMKVALARRRKEALRALAQSLARELGPKGIHVAHLIVDGQIASERPGYGPAERGPDAVLDPAAIAEAACRIHLQPRSARTQELDLRPWVERF